MLQKPGKKASSQERNRMDAIALKLKDMREGEKDFYIYRDLAARGFPPNYGFPISNIVLSLSEQEDEIQRDNVIALSEFAPGNSPIAMNFGIIENQFASAWRKK